MAQKAVDEVRVSDNDLSEACVSAKTNDNGNSSIDNSSTAKKSRLNMKDLDNRMTVMENSMKASLGQILSTLDLLKPANVVQQAGGVKPTPSADIIQDSFPKGKSRPVISLNNGIDPDIVQEDVLSVNVRREELKDLYGDDGSSHHDSKTLRSVSDAESDNSGRFQRYANPEAPKSLGQIFGCEIETSNPKQGLVLAESQIKILKKSWRAEKPDRISAYRDEYKACFPVHEDSLPMLQVPGLDSILEPMLEVRHPQKKVKPWGNSRFLYTQPLRTIETLGYQGMGAARMNIIAIAYLQQGLGALLNTLKEKEPNIDRAIQNTRDLYDMSNKALDQAGRAGAFHHMIRRKAANEDTGIISMKDVNSKAAFLPLTGNGVFGDGLTDILKNRKETKDQLADLLPEVFKKKVMKRKFEEQPQEKTSYKYQRTDNQSQRGRGKSYYPRDQSRPVRSSYNRQQSSSDYQKRDKSATQQSFRIPKKQ